MSFSRFWILVLATCSIASLPASGWAANFNVTDNGDSDCSDFNCNLQSALDAAQNNGQGDVLNLAPGNYDASGGTFNYPSDPIAAVNENFPLTIQSADPATAILDGGNAELVMHLDTSALAADDNADILIDGLTMQNGNAVGIRGGGLFVSTNDADITLNNSRLVNNQGDTFGSGAELDSFDAGNISATGNLFSGNINTNNEAGADFIATNGTIVAINNVFYDNHATGTGTVAGGLYISFFSSDSEPNLDVTLINNTLVGNSATSAGGIYLSMGSGIARIYNNIIFGNSADEAGADIFFSNDTDVTIEYFNNDVGEICFDEPFVCDPAAVPGLTQAGNINQDPLLVAVTSGNFNLNLGSPAIDTGDTNAPSLPSTDYAGNPRIIGPAPDMGALEALPDIDVSPSSLAFGASSVGSQVIQILTITNQGAGVLEIDSLDLADAVNYALDPTQGDNPCGSLTPTLAGGESCSLGVIFGPTGSGSFAATLTVNSNDPDEAQVAVPLSGTVGGVEISGNGACALQMGSAGGFSWAAMLLGLAGMLSLRQTRQN